ncbi:TetR family transcriptional regulator [Leminorella grimontii]|uniref:TetR family transcriptional regulator n=1 Tax=Leminorella grimontii TaxID=82981 RepID=UPI0032207414
MSYMAKDERRAAIVEAATTVALRDGLMNITTRKVSAEMGAATGIIHHHFSSTAELRREVFQHFCQREHRRACERIQGLTPAGQLLSLLDYSGSSADDPDSRLWNDAWTEAVRDKAFGQAYAQSLQALHEETVRIIEEGCRSGAFCPALSIDDVSARAWRLMAIGFGVISMFDISADILLPATAASLLKNGIINELGADPASF